MISAVKKDKEYKKIVKDILRNTEFKKLYNIEHHGISRMEHSIKISYYSYKVAKYFGMDYVSAAKGALLHDFFLDGDERDSVKKFLDTFIHPRKALNTASSVFDLNDIEKNIIVSHMFPIYLSIPKYKESVLINVIDKIIGLKELIMGFGCKFKYKFNYTYVLLLLLIAKYN